VRVKGERRRRERERGKLEGKYKGVEGNKFKCKI